MTSYALRSPAGALSPGGARSFNDIPAAGSGWLGSPATPQLIAEVKPDSTFSLSAGESVSLDAALTPGIVPADENVMFDFTTADGRVLEGIVEFTGAVNDFVLFVDPSDGSSALGNLSGFITPPDLTGYAVISPGDQLIPGNWNTLETSGEAGPGWDASPALTSVLAETNLQDSHTFGFGTLIELGQIFTTAGEQDLQLTYTVAGETAERTGSVVYGPIPDAPVLTPGDFNGDNNVDGLDFLLLQREFPDPRDAADFVAWEENYGTGVPAAPGAVATPEPATVWLILGAAALVAAGPARATAICGRAERIA